MQLTPNYLVQKYSPLPDSKGRPSRMIICILEAAKGCRLLPSLRREQLGTSDQIRSNQSLSSVQLFVTPWIAARQTSLSITNSRSSPRLTSIKSVSWSLLKLISIESVMPSNHLILCCPLLLLPSIFPSIRSFPLSQFFASDGQSIGASASASVLPMNIRVDFL